MKPEEILPAPKERRGYFIVIDGLDGIGKGVIERAIVEYEQKLKRSVFDAISFSRAHKKGLPELKDFWNPPEVYFDTIITAEPTYSGIGHAIRTEIVEKNNRSYSWKMQADAYSLDRLVNMQRLVIPALKNGVRVIQGRCFASTLGYQTLKGEMEGYKAEEIKKMIMQHPGNRLQLAWAPNLLIIPTIKNIDEVMKRLRERAKTQKDDNSIFDNADFQKRIKGFYESSWLRKLFAEKGTTVEYLDAGISVDETRRQTVEIYKRFLESCRIE